MATSESADPPPKSTDIDGWRRAVKDGSYTRFRLEDIVAAIQDLGPCADKDVLIPLATHFSDALLHILRARVSASHRNRGEDIIERTHSQIIEALLQPKSADGRALRKAFVPRIMFRLKDAIATEARLARLPSTAAESIPAGQGSCDEWLQEPHHDPTGDMNQQLDVERILEQVEDDQKRLAFRLFMDGVPYKSNKSDSIARALDISEKTAREWVKEVREQLSSAPEAQALLKPKLRGTP